jgi:MICOS complex subunit MIC26
MDQHRTCGRACVISFFIHPGTDLTHTHTFLSCLIFLGRVKALIAPDEPLTPVLLYVGVALLSGSILARNRSVLTHGLLPPTSFFLSFHHLLPKTSQNVSVYAGALEEAHLPTLAQKHAVAIVHAHMTWERYRAAVSNLTYSATDPHLFFVL